MIHVLNIDDHMSESLYNFNIIENIMTNRGNHLGDHVVVYVMFVNIGGNILCNMSDHMSKAHVGTKVIVHEWQHSL